MAGCDGYLIKPLESRKLRDVLEKYFDRPSIIQPTSMVQSQPLTAEEQAIVDGHPAGNFVSSFAPTFAPTVPAGITEIKTVTK